MKKFILIDGSSLAYRAFYALPDTMKTASGIPTNAIYGFTAILMKIIDENPDSIAISFDLKGKTFRHQEYPEYKATRKPQPPTLYEQLPLVKEISKALDIPVYEIEGYEADDVIGTLTTRAEKEGFDVEILTGDKDTLQLISNKTKVVTPKKGISETEIFDEKKVEAKYGITPDQIIDWKALRGDTSDNIPGVPGIGEKTATKLLQEFGTLDNLIKNVDQIKNEKLRERIKANVDQAILSQRLATIVKDVPITTNLADCKRKPLDWDKVIPLFEKFEFKTLIKKYAGNAQETLFTLGEKKKEIIEKSDSNYILINTEKAFKKLITNLKQVNELAVDTETTSVDPFAAKLVGISISFKEKEAYYIPVNHRRGKQLDFKDIISALKPILEDPKIKKVGHNIKYDMEVLSNHGINLAGVSGDSMVAAYILDPTGGSLSLKFLAPAHLGKSMINIDALIGSGKNQKTFDEIDIESALTYAACDAEYTLELNHVLEKKLKEENLLKLYQEVEVPLISVLTDMEETGTYIDAKQLEKLSKKLKKDAKELESNIYILSGEEFNINSTKQLQKILFHKLQLPVIKKTKTGISTDASVLEVLAPNFEIAKKLLDYRTISKLLSTYVDALPEIINEKTKRIHTSFNQTITTTGRLSSSNPNLQNIPAKGEYAQAIRSAFVPQKKDWVILAADYSQVELRILAHLSQDPALIQAFEEGQDIHRSTAAAVTGIPLDKVTKEERNAAKAINFGIVYGMSDFGLSKQLGIKRQVAKEFIDKYFAKYAEVQKFISKTIKFARENGYVETMLGRKRPLLDINSQNPNQRSFAERTAINTPVQGTAADMIKVAMINLHKKLEKFEAKLIIQVHDELVLEVPNREINQVKKIVEEEMRNAIKLIVPVKVDIGVGPSWAEAK
ncbi:MAG: DNA polymerase I [Candidatus Margulisbacteria bacterium]|nr:DNA polymerase I [Candidatus Margulisiibacteriota bacterium]MBU1022330.1 DNA polymerase I [Candidatus Margulisiibacteriota bacterium]MBU1729580.1 DNA polymerase I [Candidatus Margulisiibacteriota bacterium]MBU1955066.1 DNA polymerase I [Candidatus Margulisiibacteriota bacterium]